MKRIILSAILFLLATLYTQAQKKLKVDLDKRKFQIEYLALPSSPILSYFDHYTADVFADKKTIEQLKLTSIISSYLQLEGYIYSEEKAEFSYTMNIEKPTVVYQSIDESSTSVKNSDGTYRTVKKYTAIMQVSIPTTIYIKLVPYGTVLYTSTFSNVNDPTLFKSSPMDSRETAQNLLNDTWKGLNVSIREAYLKRLASEVTRVKEAYSFRKVIATSFLININDKNAPEFTEFNAEVAKAILTLQNLSYKAPIDSARLSLLPTLNFFLSTAQSIKPSDKKLKKYKYASLYNLAKCQYFLELLNDCKKTSEQIIDNDYNKNDGRIIGEDVEWVTKCIKDSGQRSRHIYRPAFDSTERYQYVLPQR